MLEISKAQSKSIIPEQDISVQLPVVIVGRPAVMRLAGGKLIADLHQEYAAHTPRVIGIFTFLGRLDPDSGSPALSAGHEV